MSIEGGPSNFVVFAMVIVTIVLVWFAWFTYKHERQRSSDRQILMQKSHQN